MENFKQTQQQIVSYHAYGKDKELSQLYNSLLMEKMKLDKWMGKYLDMFERKMNYEETDTAIWDLYKKKSNEYSKLTSLITTAKHYLQKAKINV